MQYQLVIDNYNLNNRIKVNNVLCLLLLPIYKLQKTIIY